MSQTNLNRHHRRNLPHYERENAVYFMTVCLKGSLPKHIIKTLKERRKEEQDQLLKQGLPEDTLKIELRKLSNIYFGKFDDLLDGVIDSPTWLKNEHVAQIWQDALFHFNDDRYKIVCSTIMSNHVHFIFYKLTHTLSSVMHSIKRHSGRQSNILIDKFGHAFWQDENFDRRVRNREDLAEKVFYVLNNPVKAKLVKRWQDWKWNYIRPEFEYLLGT